MVEALIVTTAIAVLLFVGVICSWIGNKLNIPDALLLIVTGMFFGYVKYRGESLVQFPELFMSSLAILALAMIVFDSTTRLRLRELDTFSLKAVKLTFITTLLIGILFTAAAHFVLKIPLWISLLFATIMIGTSPSTVLMFGGKSKTLTILKLESIFNTPLTVILPFLVLDLAQNIRSANIFSEIIEQLVPFMMKFIVGIGAGVFVAIILFKIVQKVYEEVYSPLAVIVAALLAYVLAENLGGSGVLSVTALGLFFGNVYVKEKLTLLGVESVIAKALYILVFILMGMIIKLPYTAEFFATSGLLFVIFIFIRYLATKISLGKEYGRGEIFQISLTAPKGVATAAVVFILAVHNIEGMAIVLDMTFAFILYSMILATFVRWISLKYENRPTRH